jgi:hypothetical protein
MILTHLIHNILSNILENLKDSKIEMNCQVKVWNISSSYNLLEHIDSSKAPYRLHF